MTTAILITPNADIVPIQLPADPAQRQAVMRAVIRCELYDLVALTTRLDPAPAPTFPGGGF